MIYLLPVTDLKITTLYSAYVKIVMKQSQLWLMQVPSPKNGFLRMAAMLLVNTSQIEVKQM